MYNNERREIIFITIIDIKNEKYKVYNRTIATVPSQYTKVTKMELSLFFIIRIHTFTV